MKKLVKILVIAVVATVVLIAGAAIAVPMLLDGDTVKRELSVKVKEATGRELSIPGEVKVSVFPWLGASLGKVALGNAAGFQAPVFASTEKVDVRVKLMPLLSRRVEMDTLTVHGLTVNLERDKSGKGNWEDLAGDGSSSGPGAGAGSGAGGDGGQALAGLAIGGIDVRDATLSFTDAQAGQSYALQNVTLTTGTVVPGQPVDVELGFDVTASNPPMSGRVTAGTRVAGDPATGVATLSDLLVSANLTGETLPGGKLDASLGAQVSVDGGKNTASIRELALEVADLSATGEVEVSGLDKAPVASGKLSVAEFDPKALLKALGQKAPETADAKALTRASFSTGLKGGVDSLSLDPLKLSLDDSALTGTLTVANFAAPALRFALALDAIDLDRYLPPGTDAPPATPGAAAGAAGDLPLDTLRALDVDGTVKAGKVKVAKLNVSDVSAKINAKGGLIKLSPIGARLYQGSYAGNISLDARKDTPVIALNEKLTGVQAEPLLKDLQGAAPLSGTANVTAKLTARGTAAEAVKKTLNGNLSFQFLNGAINGVNIGQMVREARAKLQGGPTPGGEGAAKTDFAEITGTAKVTNGVINNPDLSAKSPLLRITGKGTASLPTEALDYRSTVTLVATSKGQGGKELGDLAGVPIPLRITGTFTKPEYGLDTAGLAKALAKGKAKELVDKQKSKVTKKVEESVKGKLGDSAGKLLGGDEKKGGGGFLNNLLKQ